MPKTDVGNCWVSAGQDFQITVGYSEQVADEFVALEQRVQLILDTLGVGGEDDMLFAEIENLPTDQAKMCIGAMDQYTKNAKEGTANLQDGACEVITDKLNILASQLVHFIQNKNNGDHECAAD